MSERTQPVEWRDLAAVMAAMDGVADRLLTAHIPDEHGHCLACTTGGTGTCTKPWPCAIHRVASMAAQTRGRPG